MPKALGWVGRGRAARPCVCVCRRALSSALSGSGGGRAGREGVLAARCDPRPVLHDLLLLTRDTLPLSLSLHPTRHRPLPLVSRLGLSGRVIVFLPLPEA